VPFKSGFGVIQDGTILTSYWSALIRICLCCTIFEVLDAEEYRDLEIKVRITHPANLCTICTSLKICRSGAMFLPLTLGYRFVFILFYGKKLYMVRRCVEVI